MEADLDKDEIVRAETSELSGEKLLTSKYLAAGSDGDAVSQLIMMMKSPIKTISVVNWVAFSN